jgi:hypothetical protein
MGAATALMFAHTDPSIAALVLDCGFADLKQVAMEMTKHAEEAGFKVCCTQRIPENKNKNENKTNQTKPNSNTKLLCV